MTESVDRTKKHFIRGVVKKENLLYAPLIQVSKFCHRFPEMSSKQIGDMIHDAINELNGNDELLKKVPEIIETTIDGGINGIPKKEA